MASVVLRACRHQAAKLAGPLRLSASRRWQSSASAVAGKEKLVVFDTTLRDGEQSPGVGLNEDEKARPLDWADACWTVCWGHSRPDPFRAGVGEVGCLGQTAGTPGS